MKESMKMSTSCQGNDECVIELTHSWGESLEERLMTKESLRDKESFSIYKVPTHIRKQDESAYEPKIISFGPYHHGKENLKDMEMVKTHYLRQFLDRNPTKRLNDYLEEMKKLEEKARKCYSEEIVMQSDRFTEMMLLDGCFIIEFILTNHHLSREQGWATELILHDRILLENQLPFFILTALFDLANIQLEGNKTLIDVMIESFYEINSTERMIERIRGIRISHILHLFHQCIISTYVDLSNESRQGFLRNPLDPSCFKAGQNSEEPPQNPEEPLADENPEEPLADENPEEPPENPEEPRAYEKSLEPRHFLIRRCWRKLTCFRGMDESSEEETEYDLIPSAVQLQEVGIKFRVKKNGGFMGVTFSNGVFEMTKFTIDDSTKSHLRNLLAWEACKCKWGAGVIVTIFVIFMDCLINRPVDVALLQEEGVLDNFLGSEEAAVNLINNICTDLSYYPGEHYGKIFKDVMKYYNSRWSKWRAKLVRDYFSNPWAFLSLMAAILLLGLTIQQSVYSILAYKK